MIEKLNSLDFTRYDASKLVSVCEVFDYFLETWLQPDPSATETDPLDSVRKAISHLESVASTSDRAPQIFEKYAASAINLLTTIQQPAYENLPNYADAKVLAQTNIEIINTFLQSLKAKTATPSEFKPAYHHTMGPTSQPVKQDYISTAPNKMMLNKKPNVLRPKAKTRFTTEGEPFFLDPKDPHPYEEVRNMLLKQKLREKLQEVFTHETASDLPRDASPEFGDKTTASINPEDKHAAYIDRVLYQLELARTATTPVVPTQPGQYRELPVTNDSVSPVNVNFFKLAGPAIRDLNNAQFQLKNDRPKLARNVELIQKLAKKIPLSSDEIFPVYLISKDVGMAHYNSEGPAINTSNEGYYSEETTSGSVATFNKPLDSSPIMRKPKSFLDYVNNPEELETKYQHRNTHRAKFSVADGLNKFKKHKV